MKFQLLKSALLLCVVLISPLLCEGNNATQKKKEFTPQQKAMQKWRKALAERGIKVQRVLPKLPENVSQQLGLVYADYGERKMHLDLFTPKTGGGPFPAIVLVHGGGWHKGDKKSFHAMAQAFAADGYVSAAIEYRLAGEAKFPAAIHDCNAAVRWLHANAGKLKIDPDRIGAVGGSAGGHIVGLMAMAPHLEDLHGKGNLNLSSALKAAVVLSGPLELATGSVAERSRTMGDESNANRWFGKTVDEDPDLFRLASPMTHISIKTPPIFLMCAQFDQPARYKEERKKMDELGIWNDLIVMKDGKHGCWNLHPWFKPMVGHMLKFFDEKLRN